MNWDPRYGGARRNFREILGTLSSDPIWEFVPTPFRNEAPPCFLLSDDPETLFYADRELSRRPFATLGFCVPQTEEEAADSAEYIGIERVLQEYEKEADTTFRMVMLLGGDCCVRPPVS